MDLYTEYAKGVAMMNTINGEPAKTHPTNIRDEGNNLVHAHITSNESKLPANATASLAAESCFAMNTLPSSRNTKLEQYRHQKIEPFDLIGLHVEYFIPIEPILRDKEQ